MKSYYKISLLVFMGTFCLLLARNTQAYTPTGSMSIILDYENGRLLEIEDDGPRVASLQPFISPSPKSYAFYSAELYDTNNQFLVKVAIDQRNTNGVDAADGPLSANGTSGWVMIAVPFDPSLVKLVFKDSKGNPAGEAQIDSTSFCNFNNVCEAQLGENSYLCPTDCQPSPTYIPVNNTSPSPSMIPTPTRSAWKIIFPLVVWFGLAIAVGVGWFIIKKRNVSNF